MRKKAKKRWLLFSRQIGGLFKNTFRRGGEMELAQVENEPRAREKSEEDADEEARIENVFAWMGRSCIGKGELEFHSK